MGFADELRKEYKPQKDFVEEKINAIKFGIEQECRLKAGQGQHCAEGYLHFWRDDYGGLKVDFVSPEDIKHFLKKEEQEYQEHKKRFKEFQRHCPDEKLAISKLSPYRIKGDQMENNKIIEKINLYFKSEGFSEFLFEQREQSVGFKAYYLFYCRAVW